MCTAEGQPIPLIRWFKNRVEIPMQHDDTYVIEFVQLDDRANYTCTAQNMLGTITSRPARVNIQGELRYQYLQQLNMLCAKLGQGQISMTALHKPWIQALHNNPRIVRVIPGLSTMNCTKLQLRAILGCAGSCSPTPVSPTSKEKVESYLH